ncbi:MAG TPA: DUF1579 family protein [Thermomicrobiaceae bacterium]|nr:DUF1579 family protein [Thermomicrobiaceae bacterium]
MAALRPFLFDCRWVGTVKAGGMGPGSPAMQAAGKAVFQPLIDGAWLAGDFEQDQFVAGEKLITWKAHYVVGWDARAGEYRVTYVDSNGSASLLRGYIEGDRFINELAGEQPVRLRLVWERDDAGRVTWRNERAVAGGPWILVEEYVCTPLEASVVPAAGKG